MWYFHSKHQKNFIISKNLLFENNEMRGNINKCHQFRASNPQKVLIGGETLAQLSQKHYSEKQLIQSYPLKNMY